MYIAKYLPTIRNSYVQISEKKKLRTKIENINDFLNYGNFFQSGNVSGRTDWLTDWLTDSQSSLSSFYNIDLSKLNDECDCLFQTPKQNHPKSGPWYTKTPMGKNTLGNMMKSLSHNAKLSKKYTNHCIRTTSIRILDKEGFDDREICQVSGHNNQSSLASYTGRVSGNQKMNMSDAISRAIGVAHPVPSTSNTISDENPVVQEAGQPRMIQPTAGNRTIM